MPRAAASSSAEAEKPPADALISVTERAVKTLLLREGGSSGKGSDRQGRGECKFHGRYFLMLIPSPGNRNLATDCGKVREFRFMFAYGQSVWPARNARQSVP